MNFHYNISVFRNVQIKLNLIDFLVFLVYHYFTNNLYFYMNMKYFKEWHIKKSQFSKKSSHIGLMWAVSDNFIIYKFGF